MAMRIKSKDLWRNKKNISNNMDVNEHKHTLIAKKLTWDNIKNISDNNI